MDSVQRNSSDLAGALVEAHDRSLTGGVDWNADIFRFLCRALLDVVTLVDPEMTEERVRLDIEDRKRSVVAPAAAETSFTPAAPSADDIAAALLRQMQNAGLVHKQDIATAKPMAEPDFTIPEPVNVPNAPIALPSDVDSFPGNTGEDNSLKDNG